MVNLRRIPTPAVAPCVVAGLALIGLLSVEPLAYRSPAAHVAIETTAALAAAVAAYLFLGRFRQFRHLRDLLLACALALLAATNLVYSLLPAIAFGAGRGSVWEWASTVGVLAAAGLFALGALVRDRRVRHADRVPLLAAAATFAALAVAGAASAIASPALPALAAARDVQPFDAPPAALAAQVAAAALFAVAAISFHRSARRGTDELLSWLAAGCALAALARLAYFVYPSLYSDWVSAGDVLRLGFYLVLLAGAAREIRRYWETLATAAVADDRRRMARELHDGLAQELAFIVMHAKLAARSDDPRPLVEKIGAAAERALAESRHAIAALVRPPDAPLGETVAETASAVAERGNVRLDLAVADDLDVPADVREALVRIVREAVWNSARHAHAERVAVELSNGGDIRLRVADDGVGFDPASVGSEGSGFGLTSMRERAEAIGAEFAIESTPGRGTAIEVTVR